jgi:signal transduction histidine kinase
MGALKIGTADEGAADMLPPPSIPASGRWRRSRERRRLTLAVAAGLFVIIFVLRQVSMSQRDSLSVLYVIPVAIVALELGLRGGFAAASGASAAVAFWLATRDLPFDAAPLAVRAAILFGVGLIAGWFSDQMREGSEAVASENERLSVLERDQATLQAEVERMRRRLGEQLRNASRVIERQEQERRGIARQLHEEAAQTMAAALVTVGLLERGAERELTRAQFDDVRSQVRSSIADLRRIATSLRPAVLDEMGLASALTRIAEIEAEHNAREVRFSIDGLSQTLSPEAEASTYRVVEEVIAALDVDDAVTVSLSTPRETIQVVIDAYSREGDGTIDGRGTLVANGAAAAGDANLEPGGAERALDGAERVPDGGERALDRGERALDGGERALDDREPALDGDGDRESAEQSLQAALLQTRARVELVGGSLHVGSLLGDGTRVIAELPLES